MTARWRWVVNATLRPFYFRKRNPVPIAQVGGLGTRAGLDRCEKVSPLPEFDPRTDQPVVSSRYTDYSVLFLNTYYIICASGRASFRITICQFAKYVEMR